MTPICGRTIRTVTDGVIEGRSALLGCESSACTLRVGWLSSRAVFARPLSQVIQIVQPVTRGLRLVCLSVEESLQNGLSSQ